MDFLKLRRALVASGYTQRTADAKIAHDVVLQAMRDAGLHDKLAVKGGVVMSGLTDLARRATMDMDVDLMHYSLADASVRRLVARLNRNSECDIGIDGDITDLRQQDYRGKRMYLIVGDENGRTVRTKIDIGVHTYEDVTQTDYDFRVVTADDTVRLLVNPKEQIFVEKLKSLLRIGPVSTRFKDVFDMYYLSSRVKKSVLRRYLALFIYQDRRMMENSLSDIQSRLQSIFSNKLFLRRLSNPNVAWLDVDTHTVVKTILEFISSFSD